MAKIKQFNAQRKLKCAYLVPEGAWLSTIITGAEVYAALDFFWQPAYVPEYSSFDISFFHMPGRPAKNFTGLGIQAGEIDDRQYDIITIPAIWRPDAQQIEQESQVLDWLRQQHAAGALIIGLITGQFYLAAAGLLDGKLATVHGAFANTFKHQYPQIRTNLNLNISEADNLICATGHKSSMDVMMMTIARFCGEEAAHLCAKYYEFNETDNIKIEAHEGSDTSADKLDVLAQAAKEQIRHHFQEDLSLTSLASILNVSPRTLSRRFQNATGLSPMQYLQQQRLQVAQQLLTSTTLPVEHIAQRAGFNSATVFGRVFKLANSKTPLQFRQVMTDSIN